MLMRIVYCLMLFGTLPLGVQAKEKVSLKDETARINYSLGYQIGNDFKKQKLKLDSRAMLKGIQDALAGGKPMMDPAEMHKTLVELKRKVTSQEGQKRRKNELADIKTDKYYLDAAASKPGMQKTQSGLLYKIIRPGVGIRPAATDTVTVNYRGTLSNGREFDSSYKRGKPARFALNGVIKGWSEGLQLIKAGGRIQLIIAPELAYGDRGPLAHRVLIFDVDLLSVDRRAVETKQKPIKAR